MMPAPFKLVASVALVARCPRRILARQKCSTRLGRLYARLVYENRASAHVYVKGYLVAGPELNACEVRLTT